MPSLRPLLSETSNGRLHLRSVHGRTVLEHTLAVLVLPLVLLAVLDPAQPWAAATDVALALVWLGIAVGLVVRARRGQASGRRPAEWAPEAAVLLVLAGLLAAGPSPVWALVLVVPLQLLRIRWLVPSLETVAGRWHAAVLALGAVVASGSAFAAIESRDWGDGLWWSLCTMTTVGYGDIAPQTTAGRLIGVFTMLVGIGVLTALIAGVARGLAVDDEDSPDHLPALIDEVRRLHERLDRLQEMR
jgi:hypothetical protein